MSLRNIAIGFFQNKRWQFYKILTFSLCLFSAVHLTLSMTQVPGVWNFKSLWWSLELKCSLQNHKGHNCRVYQVVAGRDSTTWSACSRSAAVWGSTASCPQKHCIVTSRLSFILVSFHIFSIIVANLPLCKLGVRIDRFPATLEQRWKNVQTVQTRLCYFFSLAVLIFGLCTRKTLC